MNGPKYRHLDKRKRQIYKQYLDYSNKKVGTDRNILRKAWRYRIKQVVI